MELYRIEKGSSSNSVALEMLEKQDIKEGSVIWVNEQTGGRGQGSNKWHSEAGKNLTVSIILKPHFLKAEDQFYLSKAMALAVADYTGLFASDVSIKWFNDILIHGKKVAGILIENTWQGNKIKDSVIGIGLNLNQDKFPADLPQAISLIMSTGVAFHLEESLKMLYSLVMTRYLQVKDKEFSLLDKDYHKILFGLSEKKKFYNEGGAFEAVIMEVEPSGFIRLKHNDGRIASYGMHDIRML